MIITVTSQKGGVGKTTTAVTLAHGLALMGQRVLLVDLDGQGQGAIALGRDPEPGLYRYADPVFRDAPANVVRDTGRTGLSLLPGDSSTRRLEVMARAEADGFDTLVDRLGTIAGGYDVAVFDTAAQGILQEVAIWMADLVVIPAKLDALSVDGVHATVALAAKLSAPVSVVLPVAYDRRLNEHGAQLALLRERFQAHVMQPVPARTAVAECHACGITVYESHDNGAKEVAGAYDALVDWVGTLMDATQAKVTA
jgi:chromosome partitioning protein